MLLAIDTSTTLASLACYDQRGLLAECTWMAGRNHTAQVLPQVRLLLRHIDRRQEDLRAIAVALGPGSWSGVRVGMSIAKGMALAGDLLIIGIGTLDALAAQQFPCSGLIYPLIRLGRDRFATAAFQAQERLLRLDPYRNVALDELCATIDDRALFCGDVDADAREQLIHYLGERAAFPPPVANVRRAGYLAAMAWERLIAGDVDDLTTLEPYYLGEPVKSKTEP